MDNINSVGNFIRGVFSTLVNKDEEIFKALLASDDPDKPGTLEQIFNDVEETRNKWCNTPNVYEQEGEMLEKTLSLFSVLSRAYDESDASLKWRNKILYIRNGDTVWGDYWDIVKMFKAYFNSEFVYIVNNTDDISKNLFSGGDFEENTEAWTLNLCEYSPDARFSGRNGLLFEENGKCSQSVNVNADSVYFVHFFHCGNIRVKIKDNNGRYWRHPNPYADDFGSWVNTETMVNLPATEKWKSESVFFLTDSEVTNVKISFIGEAGTSLDYARLFKKEAYPTFSLVVVFTGRSTPETIGLAPGTDDPANTVDYSKMSYIEQAHIYGVKGLSQTGIYTELLEIVRAGGISSYIEILIKELD